jgi:hypothetical protein
MNWGGAAKKAEIAEKSFYVFLCVSAVNPLLGCGLPRCELLTFWETARCPMFDSRGPAPVSYAAEMPMIPSTGSAFPIRNAGFPGAKAPPLGSSGSISLDRIRRAQNSSQFRRHSNAVNG